MKLHKVYLDLTVHSYTVNIHDLSFQQQGNVRLSEFNMIGQGKMCLLSAFRFGAQVGIRGNTKTFLWTKKKNLLKNEVPTKESVSLSSFPYPSPTFVSHRCEN